jgi:L-ascorbate metabolism protein UlaG (beta-lactamase superfamily)
MLNSVGEPGAGPVPKRFSIFLGGDIMNVRYLGHAAFELVSENGTRLVFDPYESGAYGGALKYGPIGGEFDIAVVSHDHADHCDEGVTKGAGNVVDCPGTFDVAGVRVTAEPTYHDESKGSERGANLVSVVELDGMRIAHLGDLGHSLSEEELKTVKGVDVLFIPVGGHFTIDAETAAKMVASIGPKVVIPMHFKTDKVDFPISPVERFTGLMENVEVAGASEITITKAEIPDITKVVVLEPAL